jgi:tetratricopeptide (TPR) repeat protein
VAREHDLLDQAATSYFILSDREFRWDRYREALAYLEEALAVSRKLGSRPSELADLAEMTYALFMLGRWDEALGLIEEPTEEQTQSGGVLISLLTSFVEIHLARGRLDEARRIFSLFSHLDGSADMQDRAGYLGARASLRRAEGQLEEALVDGEAAIEAGKTLGYGQQSAKQGALAALEAAIALGDAAKTRELIASLEDASPGLQSPYLTAQAQRFRGRLDGDEAELEAASRIFRELELPFWLAVTLLEQGETLISAGQVDQAAPHLEEAREIFDRLEARPWLERAGQATAGAEAEPVGGR